jgi:hypothetical protein
MSDGYEVEKHPAHWATDRYFSAFAASAWAFLIAAFSRPALVSENTSRLLVTYPNPAPVDSLSIPQDSEVRDPGHYA